MPRLSDPTTDQATIQALLDDDLVTATVATFVEGPGVRRLDVRFDIDELQRALHEVAARSRYAGQINDGFGVIPVTRRPGTDGRSTTDLSGRYWLRPDDTYTEIAEEDIVDEGAYTELTPEIADTYFAHVHAELSARARIGRVRILAKDTYNCNSWHRDPEPRIHVPIITNPGSLMIINHHATHLPADGSAYFTDTRGYHMGVNGGLAQRVHLVAAVVPD
ncbi:MAG: hypothetical protein AAGC53_17350 [Actinomycetota bacterium]